MRNIKNSHKRIKHMNSFVYARFQRKLRKFAENGSRVSGPTFRVTGLGSRISLMRWVLGPGPTNSPRSRIPLFGYANMFRTFTFF